jgi:hypothetical protein
MLNVMDASTPNGKFIQSLGKRGENYFHVATPNGKLVAGMFLSPAYKDNRQVLQAAVSKWRQLPESDRKPSLKDEDVDGSVVKYRPKPPGGGLVLKVFMRNLKRDAKGEYALISKEDIKDTRLYPHHTWRVAKGIYAEAMPDVMWITEKEWQSIVPDNLKKNDQLKLPGSIQKRLLRFHLTDGTYAMPRFWDLKDIRAEDIKMTVEEVSPEVRLRLTGYARLALKGDFSKEDHGYEASLHGILIYDPKKKAFTRFDIVAAGDCWGGDGEMGQWARPGRAPLGFAFELARMDNPADEVPPKGRNFMGILRQYYAPEKR